MPMEDDGLDALVCALPPKYTKRFGEICWAQGGVGFGWWPAFIYDPRFTVGSARQLAQKHLGKRHLIYFFECHDAPFTVLGDNKITSWEDGMTDEYYLGRTAKASGKAKLKLFEQALQAAIVENGKPIAMRMNWNHTEQPQILPPPSALNNTQQQQQQQHSKDKKKKKDSKGKKRQQTSSSSSKSNNSNNKKQKSKRRRIISDKNQKFGFISTDSPDSSSVEEAAGSGPPTPNNTTTRHHQYASRRVFSKGGVPMEGIVSERGSASAVIPNNIGNDATATTTAATQIESSEDGELICKLIKKCDGVVDGSSSISGGGGSRSKKNHQTTTKLINIGFVKLKSRKFSTFADARIAIQEQLVLPDCDLIVDNNTNNNIAEEGGGGGGGGGGNTGGGGWKFFVPNLGPVSSKQESTLGPMFTFMKQTTNDTNLGSGYWNHPLKVLIVDSPTYPSHSNTTTTTTTAPSNVAAATTAARVSTTSSSSSAAAALATVSSSTSTNEKDPTKDDGHRKTILM